MFSVAALARFDGVALVALGSSFGALCAVQFLDYAGLAFGVSCALGGWMELRGVALLGDRPAAARRRMIGAQAVVFGSLALYCAWRTHTFDALQLGRFVLASTTVGGRLAKEGIDAESLAMFLDQISGWIFGGITLLGAILQGSLAVLYAVKVR